MNKPKFRPLHPEFPVEAYKAIVSMHLASESTILSETPAPFSWTSFKGLDESAPALGWRSLVRIWRQDNATCEACGGPLRVYGLGAQMTRACIARACLGCKLEYLEDLTRGDLESRLRAWGFRSFKVGLGRGLVAAGVVWGSGQPATPDEARAHLLGGGKGES
jgi:hypothetical protein